jgi:hypothetical protein
LPATPKPFNGPSFFQQIRSEMDKNRGMFFGIDGGMSYVCMDASFYSLSLLLRDSHETFTDAAKKQASHVRAIANGQIFGTSRWDYCVRGPCSVQWQGEIVYLNKSQPGNPGSASAFRAMGQWTGCSEASFGFTKGDPSSIKPAYVWAMGRLLPLVEKKTPVGQGPLGSYWTNSASKGKAVYGVSRPNQVVFMLIQNDGGVGLTVPDLINRLVAMGVDDAVMGDGSDSAALIVDGVVEVAPGQVKNYSIPVGPMFHLNEFRLTGKRSLRKVSPKASFVKKSPMVADSADTYVDTEGTIRATNGGLQLDITSFGYDPDAPFGPQVKAPVASLPIRFEGTTSLITGKVTLTGKGASGELTLLPEQTSDGRVTGFLVFGATRFDFDWEVTHNWQVNP